jgi:hypothetical protein
LRRRLTGLFRATYRREGTRRATLEIPLIAGVSGDALAKSHVVLLDDEAVEGHLAALGSKVGAMPAHAGSRFTQKAARRLAARFAARYAARLGMRPEALSDAWYFSIWSELCTLIPLRHVARRVARVAGGAVVVIPLEPAVRPYLTFWDRSGIEPLYLAAELRRRGVAVAFASHAPSRKGKVTMRLVPHPAWQKPRPATRGRRHGAAAVAIAGMRGVDTVLSRIVDPLLVACSFAAAIRYDLTIADPQVGLPSVEMTLPCEPASILARPAALAGAFLPAPFDLGNWLFDLLGPATAAASRQARREIEARGLSEAHICDHLFWESAILAHAVREAGGRVVLWPHSSNALHVAARPPGNLARIHCATRSASRAWQARFPDVPIEIVSETILQPSPGPRRLTPTEPITVAVIAGSHSLNRLPVIDHAGHIESYRRLFRGLAAAAPGLHFVCKAKPPWESIAWLRSLVGADTVIEEIDEAPTRIDLPNLIYVSVSFGSTALLEGLGRGIPCMIVRDIPVEDYTAIGPDVFPVGPVEMILARLRECRDVSAFRAMTQAQLAWYAQETHFKPAPRSQENMPR